MHTKHSSEWHGIWSSGRRSWCEAMSESERQNIALCLTLYVHRNSYIKNPCDKEIRKRACACKDAYSNTASSMPMHMHSECVNVRIHYNRGARSAKSPILALGITIFLYWKHATSKLRYSNSKKNDENIKTSAVQFVVNQDCHCIHCSTVMINESIMHNKIRQLLNTY